MAEGVLPSAHKSEDLLMEEEDEAKVPLDTTSSLMTWVYENRGFIICIIILVLLLKWKLQDIKRRWFAAFMQMMTNQKTIKSDELKSEIFASIDSVVSNDPALRKVNAIKILEIGVGTGTNFEFYPKGTRLTVVDPNPHFKKYYNENRKKFPNIHSEDIIETTGEKIDMIPNNSMDVVVMTMVCCSVLKPEKIFKQILRVLTPGGKFYFYEHIREFDSKNHGTRRMFQTFLSKSGIWPFIFDNCRLDRDMVKALEGAGFSKVDAKRFYAPIDHFLWQLIKPSLRGFAQK